MSTKRELVLKAFHNEKTDRVPVGFWFHFLEGGEFNGILQNPEILQKNFRILQDIKSLRKTLILIL